MSYMDKIDVVICTYKPDKKVLSAVLDGLALQTLPKHRWNLTIVNNYPQDSSLQEHVRRFYPDLEITILNEEKPGLIYARLAAMASVKSDLIVFSDDDTVLDPTYLENAVEIAKNEPDLGAFGGKSIGHYSKKPPKWFLKIEGHVAVRDYGDDSITSSEDKWGKWEPIGAGFVVKRPVWELFVTFCNEHSESLGLGRSGKKLMAGEDSLLARMSYRLGMKCGYRPQLSLVHRISSNRVNFRYMCRILRGHGASYFHLQRLLEKTEPFNLSWKYIIQQSLKRWFREGLAGLIRTNWETGYKLEKQKYSEN